MHQPQVLSRALNTHNYRKDVVEPGSLARTPSSILGKAQDSLYSSKAGLRRLFGGGGSSKDIVVPSQAPDEPETLEIAEPGRQQYSTNTEDMAARIAKARRSSMTTYTVNLGGAPTGQVAREVRRLAGLAPAFIRPSAIAEVTISHATSFDAVEEMGSALCSAGTGDGDEDSDGEQCGPPPPQRSSTYGGGGPASGAAGGGRGGAGAGRGPIKSAFSGGAVGEPIRISVCGDAGSAGVRQSIELADVTSMPSSSNVGFACRPLRPPSLPQAFLASGGSGAAAAAALTAAGGGGGGALFVSPVTPPTMNGQLGMGHLGFMKDRKATRQNMLDGISPSSSPGGTGPNSSGGGGGGGASPTTTVLKLPTLPLTLAGRTPSSTQLASGPPLSPFTSSVNDSRPGSSRLVLGRSGGGIPTATAAAAAAGSSGGGSHIFAVTPDRRASLESVDLSTAAATESCGGGGGGGGGGRWFQQDTDDVDVMLAGNEELLERLMTEGELYGSGGGGAAAGAAAAGAIGSGPSRDAGSTGDGSLGEPGLLLPRLADSSTAAAQDRATAQLQELWKVQANVEEQLNRERHAKAVVGRMRRASVLEDIAGQQQPRWQVSYNVEAPVTHAKLGTVDASRRNEIDRAHLAKLVKEQKGSQQQQPQPQPVAAAAVSPVVARARRLSTVMVA